MIVVIRVYNDYYQVKKNNNKNSYKCQELL